MCEPPVIRSRVDFVPLLPECSRGARRDHDLEISLEASDGFRTGYSCKSEVSPNMVDNPIGEVRKQITCNRNFSNSSCIFRLEQDVQNLQKLLQEEMQLHSALESALDNAAAKLSDISHLPDDAQQLLFSISTLETTISRLEEETVSLHFQLIQERNERRLAEYRLKQLHSQSLCTCSPKNDIIDDILMQEEKVSSENFQHAVLGRLKKQIPVKGLWNYPNQLSEEIVRCMKNIFISLADSSTVSSNSFLAESLSSSSPYGHLSSSSSSLSELSVSSSWGRSPQVDLRCSSELLATENAFDPYKVRGKLSWIDIGNYSLAKEVSWMSVGKKQLEYAAGALRRFSEDFHMRCLYSVSDARSLIEQLAEVNPNHLNGDEKLAFWINLYNALIMHAYLAYGVPRSDMKLFSLMQKTAYTVGGHSFSAACIEYVILKMKPPPHRPQTALLLALHKLKVSDEQKKFSVETPEPLVAFALSCGAYSSPAVKIYTPGNIKGELQEAQCDFIRASVGVSNKGKLLVPKMLHCFARGFVDDSNLAIWISRFLSQQQAAFVEHCISQRKQSFLSSRNCGVLPFDSRFRYLFLPEALT